MNCDEKIDLLNNQIRELYEKIRQLKKQKNKIYSSEYYKKNKEKLRKKVNITKCDDIKFKKIVKSVVIKF
tara:strand:+ start:164 stop:373 length:210 start_codon:yes stop_codon:yes gene_type:complete